jgi:hypothetical protein
MENGEEYTRTDVRARSYKDIETQFLSGLNETNQVQTTREVPLTAFLFVFIPCYISLNSMCVCFFFFFFW